MENSNAGEITLNSYDGRVEKVKEYLEKNDLDGAKVFLSKFLTVEPNHPHACFIMAQIQEAEGNFSDAAEFYSRVFTSQIPQEFYHRVVNVYENADKYDNLYSIYNAQYQQNPDDMDLCERLANTCSILGKNEQAVELYNKILTNEPDNQVALRQLADIYENTNPMMFRLTNARIAELENNMEKAEKEYKKAFTLAEKDEDILQIRYKMAKLYRSLGKNEQALDEYIYILSVTEENFRVFLELADIYTELNNTPAAINVLKRALHIYPENKEVMQLLADTYLELEDFDKAENYYERLVEAEPDNIENSVNLAKVYLNLNKIEETKEILLKTEKTDPNNTEVLTAMAGFYTYTNDFDKAKSYCTRIIQKLPNSPLGYRKFAQLYQAMGEKHLSHFNYAIYHELRGENEDAIAEYVAALNCKRDDFETMKKLANLYENISEPDSALDYYHMLLNANVEPIETTQKIANLYIKMGEYELAQKYIDETLKTNNDVELYYLSAKCLYKLRDYEGAIENLYYYKEHTKSIEHVDEVDKLINEIESKKETSYNPFAKLFKFLDK